MGGCNGLWSAATEVTKKLCTSCLLAPSDHSPKFNRLKAQQWFMCCTFIDLRRWLAKSLSCSALGFGFSKHFLLSMIYGTVVAR